MEKLDYSDINKFLASLGVIIIGIGLILPYFYLKEDFGLNIAISSISQYSEITKSILATKERYVSLINNWILHLSGFTIIIGLTFFWIGFRGWNIRQKKLDTKLEKEIEKIGSEIINIKSLTRQEDEDEKEIEIQEEIIETVEKNQKSNENIAINYSDRINNYIRIEKIITDLFFSYNPGSHTIYSQQKIDDRMSVDLLLQAKESNTSDVIVEIKYFQTLHPGLAKKNADKMNTNTTYYRNKTGKFTIPVLIIVIKNESSPEEIARFKEIIRRYKIGLPDIEEMIIEIISEENLPNLDVHGIFGEIRNRSQFQMLHQHFLKSSK